MSINVNKKSFKLINRISKTFSIYMANFDFATTLIFRIRDKIKITFIGSFVTQLTTLMRIKRVRLIISAMKLISKLTQTINSKTVKITYNFRQRMKSVTVIHILNPIVFISKARQKIVTILGQGKVHINATALYAVFVLLGTLDPQTLGTLDTETLGDLDYTLV